MSRPGGIANEAWIMDLQQLVETYGYAALFVGTFLEGEIVLVIAGFMAHRGYLRLEWVMLVAALGTLCGDQLFYYIGRTKGQALLQRRPKWRARALIVRRWLNRYPRLIVLGFRFVYGIRNVTPFAIGASGFPPRRFVPLNILGAVLWAVIVGALGYLFGRAMESVLRDIRKYEGKILVALVMIGLTVWLIRSFRAPPVLPDDNGNPDVSARRPS